MGAIQITGLAANDPVPGSYVQVAFAQGDVSMGGGSYPALIMASKTSAGSATADTMIYGPTSNPPLSTEADAIALFGPGSPAHRMWQSFVSVNKTTPVYVICPSEAATGTAATGTITITGTASGAGTLRAYVGEKFVEVSVSTNDTPTVIAAALVSAISAQTSWAVTATASAGVVTLTAKVKNKGQEWGRYSATISSGITTTVTPTVSTKMTTGTGIALDYTSALATISPLRFYYIIPEETAGLGATSTALSALQSQIDSSALPLTGIRQRMFVGAVDSSLTTNLSANLNSPRAEVIWSPDSDRRPEELAAYTAGVYSLEEQGLSPRCNFSGYGLDTQTQITWNVQPPRKGTAPTRSAQVAALNAGITPIGVTLSGRTYIIKRVTTKYQTNSLTDYRIRDAHKVTIMDRFADDLQAKLVLQFSGLKIGNDPAQGQRTPGPDVVTPKIVRAAVIKLLRDYEALDLVENVDASITALIVQRESVPTTRMGIRLPIDVIDICDQFASALDQVA